MMEYIEDTWELNRSLVTDGYDEALTRLEDYAEPDLDVHEIPSGTDCWTWTVPPKWSIEEAYISDGETKLLEYDHPLRVVTYSNPVDRWVSHQELLEHLHWDQSVQNVFGGGDLPAHPGAIPYVFDFYNDDWGFCIRETELDRFDADEYYVHIDASFTEGSLKVGEMTVEGERDETILMLAHLDHPAQVNDDLAGVAVGTEVMNRLRDQELRYTYTFLVVPETIGSIAFFSQNEHRIDEMKYGLFLEMLGTDGDFALQYSHEGDTMIDNAAEETLARHEGNYDTGEFRNVIGNDEMVTNGPGLRIPTASLSRWPYPEYHTSFDTPDIISQERLQEAVEIICSVVDTLERNRTPVREFKGPVFLSGVGLWDKWGGEGDMMEAFEEMIMYLEGDHTILDIATECGVPFETVEEFIADMQEHGLITYDD